MRDEATIRPATLADVPAVVEVLRASITTLCVEDHHDEPAALSDWLANKTVENVERWLAQPGQHMLVAVRSETVCGVASVGASGPVHLCYVLPEHARCGVGRSLMRGLEAHARVHGLHRLCLDSTLTAERFYRAMGFESTGNEARSYEKALT